MESKTFYSALRLNADDQMYTSESHGCHQYRSHEQTIKYIFGTQQAHTR